MCEPGGYITKQLNSRCDIAPGVVAMLSRVRHIYLCHETAHLNALSPVHTVVLLSSSLTVISQFLSLVTGRVRIQVTDASPRHDTRYYYFTIVYLTTHSPKWHRISFNHLIITSTSAGVIIRVDQHPTSTRPNTYTTHNLFFFNTILLKTLRLPKTIDVTQ